MGLSSWLRMGKRSAQAKQVRPSRSSHPCVSFRPQLDVLEDRCLPSFSLPTSYPVGTAPQAVGAIDLNNDNKADLVTANLGTYSSTSGTYSGGGVSVLLTKPRGGFGPAQSYAIGSASSVVVTDLNGNAVDFNGDGKPDIAAGNVVLLGNGNGTFQIGPTLPTALGTYAAAANVNGDGTLDLITANQYGHSISVLLGNGDGTFRAGPTVAVSTYLKAVAVGDFNRDGKLDLMTGTQDSIGDATVSLLPGNGDGTFGTAQTILSEGIYEDLQFLTVGDFNADGKFDIAVSLLWTGYSGGITGVGVTILLGNGDGTFGDGTFTEFTLDVTPSTATGLTAVDFNGDGKLDLLAVGGSWGGGSPTVSLLLGNGDGTFGAAQDFIFYGAVSSRTSFAVGDFNGDGYLDVAVAGSSGNGSSFVDVLLWNTKKNGY
jgi:hypothetical protein